MKWPLKLKIARKVKGKTLRDVEQDTGISNPYLSQLENGKIKEPGYFVIIKLLKYYRLSHDDIFKATIPDELIRALSKLETVPDYIVKCQQCGGKYLKGAMCPTCYRRHYEL